MLYIFICINAFWKYVNVQETVLYPTIFLPYEWPSVFYNNLHTRSAYPSGISSSTHDTKLNFVPVIPCVKELQSMALTSSRGWYINYRPKANFYWPRQELTVMSLFNLFFQGKRFFDNFRAFFYSEKWRSNFRMPNNWSAAASSFNLFIWEYSEATEGCSFYLKMLSVFLN